MSPTQTDEFAKDVDTRIRRAFCQINDIAESFDDTQRKLYETPTAWGGIGMRAMHDVRNAAFVGGWLQCASHIRHTYGPLLPHYDTGWAAGAAVVDPFK